MKAFAAYATAWLFTLDQKFEDRSKGATAVEYGLLVGLIAVVIIAAVTLLGSRISGLFNQVATALP